jgi:uncharacterized repeat protein (TIGR01451 family)
LKPVTGGALHISGALNLGADLKWTGLGPAAGSQYPQLEVDGGVTLSGVNEFDSGDSTGFAAGQSYLVILNGSPNPIAGTFENRPEGTLIHIAGGPLALKLSYQMNGDGQATGNDFGFTVIDTTASDRTLALAGPVAVGFGEEIALTYTLGNAGPAAVTGARFEGIVPAGATFLGSTPAGTLSGEILTIPLADMPAGGNATVLMRFQAGNQQGGLATGGSFKGTTADPDGSDPVANRVIAILPGGADGTLPLSGFSQTATGDGVGLSLATIAGVKYRVEGSADLTTWETVEEFTGNGEVITRALPVDERKEFFRVAIVE